jgi:DNA-binding transcriptional LysR family regulator
VVFGRLHLLPVITAFLQAYPEITIRLVLGDRVLNLYEDSVDLALRIGALPDSALLAVSVGSIRRVVCASPAYLASNGKPQQPHDLEAHQCVSFDPLATADSWRFQADGVDFAVAVHPRLTVSTAEAAIDAAISGVGVTRVLSYQVESALRSGGLTLLLEAFEPPPLPVRLLYTSQGRLPQKLRAMLDFAAPRLRARLQAAEVAGER